MRTRSIPRYRVRSSIVTYDGASPVVFAFVQLITSSVWMLVISILLSWLPVTGPLVGGMVGGHKVGTVSRAILAALLPIVALVIAFAFFADIVIEFPVISSISKMGIETFLAIYVGPMLLGAVIGAMIWWLD